MRTSRPAHGSRARARRVTRRLIGPLLAALMLGALTAGPAAAQATSAEVAAALAESPVYVADDAPIKPDRDALLRKVQDAGTPIYIAVLPDSARQETNGNTDVLGGKIADQLNRPGTYLITAGTKYTAASSRLSRGEAKQLAGLALKEHGRDLDAGLGQFVDQVSSAAAKGEPAAQSGGDGGGGGVGIGTIAVLTALLVGGGALIFSSRRR